MQHSESSKAEYEKKQRDREQAATDQSTEALKEIGDRAFPPGHFRDRMIAASPGLSGGKIAAALAKAQAAFKPIKKNREVSFGVGGGRIQYKYADLAEVYNAVRDALSANGLALSSSISGEFLTSRIIHDTGEQLTSVIRIGNPGPKWQEFGKNVTYATRYNVSTLLGIASEDDVDAVPAEEPKPKQKNGRKKQDPAVRARSAALACKTPRMLTRVAEAFADKTPEEKKAVHAVAKERGWKWVDNEYVFGEGVVEDGQGFA